MIHFDFTVSDADAENIIDCIQQTICKNHMKIMDFIIAKDDVMVEHYKQDIEYLEGLIKRMSNTRVEDDEEEM